MSTTFGGDPSAQRRPPVARWLSLDEMRLVASRGSEKHALQFCEDLLSNGTLDHVRNYAANLRGNKCTIDPTRIAIGDYSMLFHLRFDGNSQCWILRIRLPRPGESLTAQQQIAESLLLESEISTMCYVKAKSSIPVPAVYAYGTTFSNPLGHSYMLIEHVHGTTAMWATMSCSVNQRRRLIRNMAHIVNELSSLTFPVIGQLRLQNTSSDEVTVGQLVTRSGHIIGPFQTSSEYYCSRASLLVDRLKRTTDVTTSNDSNGCHKQSAVDLAIKVTEILQRRSISDGSPQGPFVLKHPDLSFQNILVNDEFKVVAVLDWSFASVVPLEEFGYFHTPATSRLLFITQQCDEQVTSDHQYFLMCLDEDRIQRDSPLHLSCTFESVYTEMASYLAAVEAKRPEGTYLSKLNRLVDRYIPLLIDMVIFPISHRTSSTNSAFISGLWEVWNHIKLVFTRDDRLEQ